MALDIVWIDSQIARLRKLREIATDPEMMKLMRLAESSQDPDVRGPIATGGAVDESVNGNEAPKTERGALTKAVTDAALRQTDWFTGYELTERMQADGFKFAASNPSISVIDVLRKLAAKESLEVQEGLGSIPNRYRRKATVQV